MGTIYDWVRRNLSDHQVVNLLTLLVGGLVVILVFGPMLVPFFASIAIAYLLDGPVEAVSRRGVPRMGAILIWFGLFLALLFLAVFWLLPLLIQQVSDLIQQLPAMIGEAQRTLLELSERYPRVLSEEILRDITGALKSEIG
ncbi:MAG TPA: AI-2E family transporter, partial [Desulfuromonadales bacterium]|nr:AI-2E family transporter [Desulfuromonadales bacterium]